MGRLGCRKGAIREEKGGLRTSKRALRHCAAANAYRIGDAETVVEKLLCTSEALDASRLDFQMTVATLPHAKMMKAVEILGIRVAPAVRIELHINEPANAPAS